MESSQSSVDVRMGGKSCRICRHWQQHSAYQLSLLKLSGTTWGRCMSPDNNDAYLDGILSFKETREDRANVDVEDLTEDIVIISTSSSYKCNNFKGLPSNSKTK